MHAVVSACMEQLQAASFNEALLQAVANFDATAVDDPEKTIRQIVCYGVGNFSRTSLTHFSAPVWQLACALHLFGSLRKNGMQVSMLYYEPCSTPFENEILGDLNVQVLTVNERGKRSIQGIPTLFYMPHCPSQLYDNVLWSNWDELVASTLLIIVGNSLRNHCDSLGPATACPSMHRLLPWLKERRLDSDKLDTEDMAGNFVGAFNDTYWTSFGGPGDIEAEWPERPPETLETDQEVL